MGFHTLTSSQVKNNQQPISNGWFVDVGTFDTHSVVNHETNDFFVVYVCFFGVNWKIEDANLVANGLVAACGDCVFQLIHEHT